MSPVKKVLIVAEHASMRFGGEASLAWHYFTRLRSRGVETFLVAHERTRDELVSLAPDLVDHMHFIQDTRLNIAAWKLGRHMPAQLSNITLGYASRIATQLTARRILRELVRKHGIDIVHQPLPVSPREPSLIVDVGAPVVMGPMNGNMSYPPGVRLGGRLQRLVGPTLGLARRMSDGLHLVMRGKREARLLLVANDRTRRGLPPGCRGEVVTLVENGIDTELWKPRSYAQPAGGPVRFAFMGRLVDWKAVDIILKALARTDASAGSTLDIIGDGPMRPALEAEVTKLGLGERVRFLGFQPQQECAAILRRSDVLLLPSLYECGGAVVLEAMAVALPVIATDWGGPADYLDESCGVLVAPTSRQDLVAGFASAMNLLAGDAAKRRAMGLAARERALRHFDWDDKISRILSLYSAAIAGRPADAEPQTSAAAERLAQHQFMLRAGGRK